MKHIIGISAFYHDSAAALISNGEIKNAVQEERFTRIKNDQSFPINSIKFLIDNNKIKSSDIEYFVFYEKPFLKFERLIETYVANFPKGFKQFKKSIPIWLKEKLFLKSLIRKNILKINKDFKKTKILFEKHHNSHAASAFFPSPFEEALILTIDGVGEWETTTISLGHKNKIKNLENLYFPHSLGLLYSAFTYYLGFKVNSDEYKVMGLAPYGKPNYYNQILDNLIDIKNDGSFRLNQKFFNYATGLEMINLNFEKLFNQKKRINENEELTEFHADIAASIQKVINYVIIKICKYMKEKYKKDNLCLAGGVALNCVTNGYLHRQKIFKNIWIQPAAGDAGGSIGSALSTYYKISSSERIVDINDKMKGGFLGPSFSNQQIEEFLIDSKINYDTYSDKDLFSTSAKYIEMGLAIGWFQGSMEFGPRALGSRSIIADPRKFDMQKNLNLKIKFRESFRPFAPAILEEEKDNWFEDCVSNQYMLFVSYIKKKYRKESKSKDEFFYNFSSYVPAVTHVDYSARVQTVNKKNNPKFYNLINEFYKLTKVPMLVNTSFNVRGEPIVCTPEDAYKCFMSTNLDILIMNNFIIKKK